jgi:hypothetical protein
MNDRININVSAVDYNKTSKAIAHKLSLLEEMVHGKEDFVMTDSEFAFGWHFFVLSVNRSLVEKLVFLLGLQTIWKVKNIDSNWQLKKRWNQASTVFFKLLKILTFVLIMVFANTSRISCFGRYTATTITSVLHIRILSSYL